MTQRDWLLDLINSDGHLAWVRIPCVGHEPLRLPGVTVHWDRDDQAGERWLLVSHPDLPRVYDTDGIPTMRPVWGEVVSWKQIGD